ncbi:hypothetical protein APHAL10511_006357 [Amanita phalloides]|nr:hypothetical protein APHAL10511_006357 [Amanita phalloides]
MKALGFLVLFALACLVSSAQAYVTVFTSLILSTGFGAGRTPTVATRTVVFTSTLPPPSSTSANNSSSSSNGTLSASASGNATRSSSTITSNLPTAPSTVAVGGVGGVAPSPGENGGPFGPPDGYVAAATALKRNAFLRGEMDSIQRGTFLRSLFIGHGHFAPIRRLGYFVTTAVHYVMLKLRRFAISHKHKLSFITKRMSNTLQTKRQKVDHPKVIGTHSGAFHCDEALAVFLLRQTTTYRDAELRRTRDPEVLKTCDIVVDVGAVYDEATQRFDHHQRGFSDVFGHGFVTKLSSAGLIYKHFGKDVISNTTRLPIDDPNEFIEAIDAVDNGISQYPADIEPRYRRSTDLSSRVGHLNPAWNEAFDPQSTNGRFGQASELAGTEFLGRLNYYSNAWLPARSLLVSSITSSQTTVDPTGRIILLEQFLPWKEHLFELESDGNLLAKPNQAIYIVYPDESANNWRVQAVPVSPGGFESRKALPEAWRGLRDEELSKISGINGGIFVHASGFTGGNKTKDGALELARVALAM